ncbi:MAG: amidohydrolase [Acidimicrobiales bacterium]
MFTADEAQPFAEAVVIAGSRLAYVGSTAKAVALAGPGAKRIDADGGLVLPGFVDGHVHVAMTGANLRKAQLRDAVDLDDICHRIARWADANPTAPRVLGTSWLGTAIPGGVPTKEMLDAVIPDRPVYLEANDLHSSWVNSAALAELGIDRDTPDPIGGRIVRDVNGDATGHLLENANIELVWQLLADVPDSEIEDQVLAALDAYRAAGITSAVEMAVGARELAAMARLEATGRLTARIVAHVIVHRSSSSEAELAQVEAAVALRDRYRSDRLRVAGIKLITDGTIDACTAAMIDPYTNGTNDEPIWPLESLQPVVTAADAAGLQVAIHAIGDQAVRNALDALELAAATNGTSGRRHRIEHLESAQTEDIARLGPLGVTASMQPVHLDPAILPIWIQMLGVERAENGFAWPGYLDGGATLVFGTDTPTAPLEPLPNMYLASTRRSRATRRWHRCGPNGRCRSPTR